MGPPKSIGKTGYLVADSHFQQHNKFQFQIENEAARKLGYIDCLSQKKKILFSHALNSLYFTKGNTEHDYFSLV